MVSWLGNSVGVDKDPDCVTMKIPIMIAANPPPIAPRTDLFTFVAGVELLINV